MKKLIKQDFWGFVFIGIATLLLFTLGAGWLQYRKIYQQTRDEVQEEAFRLDKGLRELFQSNEELLAHIGKEILESDSEDFLRIWHLLKEIFGGVENTKRPFIWPDIGWVTADNHETVNTYFGVLAHPADLSKREYTQIGAALPWKLLFAKTGPGIPEDLYHKAAVIPFGMAVTDNQGKLTGYAVAAYRTSVIQKILDDMVQNQTISFLLFDNEEMILNSLNVKDEEQADIPVSFTKNVKGTPFTVLTYISKDAMEELLFEQIAPRSLKIMVEGTCLILLSYFFLFNVLHKNDELKATQKKLEEASRLAQSSDKAKSEFLKKVREELKLPFVTIVTYAEILRKHLTQEMNLDISPPKQLEFLDRIKQACHELETLSTRVLDPQLIDINSLLKECLTIKSKEAFVKGVTLNSFLPDLPSWRVDELRFKQLIVGFLSRSLEFGRKGDCITLIAKLNKEEGDSFLTIQLEDSGIGLSEEERRYISAPSQGFFNVSRAVDGTHLELATLQQLVVLLKGSYTVHTEWKKGTVVTLKFPFEG